MVWPGGGCDSAVAPLRLASVEKGPQAKLFIAVWALIMLTTDVGGHDGSRRGGTTRAR